MDKKKIADKRRALDEIARQIENCKICKKGKIGLAVPGEGNPDADIVFLGEAPGKQEAAAGRPFIGRAGKVLRSLIKDAGLKDEDVYITSPVKYLPKYVTPKPADIEHGRLHLFKQLEIIKPKIVVLLGNVAVKAMFYDLASPAFASPFAKATRDKKATAGKQAVLHEKFSIAKVHGKITRKDGITYLITYHPAAPLYNPPVKKELMKDFKKLKKLIQK